MTVVFRALLAIGFVLGVLAGLLIWRARSAPRVAAAQASAEPGARLGGWIATAFEAIDYASTRRAWRYRLPWILLLGERGAGKTSFALSAKALAQSHPDGRYASLDVPGGVCSVMNRGVLIDVDGAVSSIPAAAPALASDPATATRPAGEKTASRWQALMSSLVDLRPERPIDGIVLTVSARTLLNADPASLDRLAADAYRQLCDVQDVFRFIQPVSVVVTQCDLVDGFAAFWRAQPEPLRQQMFGWSAPAPEVALDDTLHRWCQDAFGAVIEQLRALQLDGAARAQAGANATERDGILLFPARLDALRAPLAQWLSTAFRATLDRPGHLCRGIYFTGDLDGGGVAARDHVAFVAGLLDDKVFAERGNARVIRGSVWSRNRYLRAFQIVALSAAAALAIGLGFAGPRLNTTVHRLDKALAQLQTATPYSGGICPSAGDISMLLMSVSELDTRSFDLFNPWSWFQHPLRTGAAQVVADHVFTNVILPGIGCQLTVRAEDLRSQGERAPKESTDSSEHLREALNARLRAVTDLEAHLGTFERVAKPSSGAASEQDLGRFARLVNFAYGLPVSLVLRDGESGLLAAALNSASTEYRPNLRDDLADTYASQLARMEEALRDALVREASAAPTLLADLNAGRGDPAAQTRQLVRWLDWTRDNWLGPTAEPVQRNLCGQIHTDLTQQIRQLVLTDSSSRRRAAAAPGASGASASPSPYSRLFADTDATFSAVGCDTKVYKTLDALSAPPYSPLLTRVRGERIFDPAFSAEFAGLAALSQLRFMQATQKHEAFACSADGASALAWNADSLGDAAAYIEEYRRFAQRFALQPANAPGPRPLYGQIAAKQLENALNHALNDAQRQPPEGTGVWPVRTASTQRSPVPFDEPALAQASRDLARGLGPLIATERSYDEFGFSGSFRHLSDCLQRFAANHLSTIASLAVQSQLYVPETNAAGPAFFDLGTPTVTRDYLARQVARAQVLAAYAAPFATLSQNSGNAANAGRNAQSAAYWSNSIAEVNRYVPARDPASQLGQLAALFVDRLNGMTADNCHARLPNHAPAAGDDTSNANDLFAALRRNLVSYARLRCEGIDAASFQQVFLLFDTTLAGRYPFGLAGAEDASPLAVRDFFAAYAQKREELHAHVGSLPKDQQSAVKDFLDRLDEDQKFFAATLRADGSLAVHLNTAFNVRQSAERGADQLVGWMLSSASQSASYPNGQTGLDWIAGQPLVLDLTWADLSRWAPYANPALPDAPDVEGRTATFTAGGTWALVRLVQQHPAGPGVTPADGIALRFSVPIATAASGASAASSTPPTAATGTAQLMINLQLQAVDPASHTAAPLKLPAFPSSAPVLQVSRKTLRAAAGTLQIPAIPTIPSLPPLPPLPPLLPDLDAQTANTNAAN